MSLNKRSVQVFAPATIANLGCGFDVLGMSLEAPGDLVVITECENAGISLTKITGDNGKLPTNPSENTATVAIQSLLNALDVSVSWEVEIHKQMPLGSGMGSSAASAAAGVWAAVNMLGLGGQPKDFLKYAMEGERIACGAAHADNVGPSLMGGIVLIRSYDPLEVLSLPVPDNLYYVLVHPEVEVPTIEARAIMRRQLSVSTAIAQWGNLGAFISALYESDYGLIGRSVVDYVAEPVRGDLIPNFAEVKKAVFSKGALACSISGSGPSVFALAEGSQNLEAIANAMREIFHLNKIESQAYWGKAGQQGARVIADIKH